MIKRQIKAKVGKSLRNFPIVGLIGSRQVGKTTLAKELQKKYKKSIYIDLELPSDLNKLQDPELYLKQYEDFLIIIDEDTKDAKAFSATQSLG